MKTWLCLFVFGVLCTSGYAQQKPVKKVSTPPALSSPKPDSIDKETGLINDANFVYVKAHCTGCHSSKLIIQHRFSRTEWQNKIRWMQRYHKLWELGDAEKNVLDYLEKHYSSPTLTTMSLRRQKALKDFVWYKL